MIRYEITAGEVGNIPIARPSVLEVFSGNAEKKPRTHNGGVPHNQFLISATNNYRRVRVSNYTFKQLAAQLSREEMVDLWRPRMPRPVWTNWSGHYSLETEFLNLPHRSVQWSTATLSTLYSSLPHHRSSPWSRLSCAHARHVIQPTRQKAPSCQVPIKQLLHIETLQRNCVGEHLDQTSQLKLYNQITVYGTTNGSLISFRFYADA